LRESAVLVIGGGIAGITSALSLAESGLKVRIVERDADIGGHGGKLCCKATDVCHQCGACIVAGKIERLRSNAHVAIMTETELMRLDGSGRDFQAHLVRRDTGENISLKVNAVIAASGFAPFDARHKPHLGYKECADILTGLDLEEQIRATGSVQCSDGRRPRRIAFIQCVGSRDVHIGNDYCSGVCCKYALRMASLLQSRIPDLEVTIFYMDIQVGGKGFHEFYEHCRKTMRFIRTIPTKVAGNGSGTLEVRYEDVVQGQLAEEAFDMVVLSVGMVPATDAADLAEVLGVSVNRDGFFNAPDPVEANGTDVEGIFLAGACHAPKDIEGSIAHAQAAAMRTISFLGTR
jgi:heterodisulfide reductase subunit A